jgi:hypothetical protein
MAIHSEGNRFAEARPRVENVVSQPGKMVIS